MFEATLHAADPDLPRVQRLILATAIAIASTSVAVASVWTLERLQIDRLGGPSQKLELTHLSLLAPPKPPVPPPPPPELVETSLPADLHREGRPIALPLAEDSPSDVKLRSNKPSVTTNGSGIPSFSGAVACPGGLCLGSNQSGGTTPCVGPQCSSSGTTLIPTTKSDAAPTEVEFSALRCLACADPDRAALRKTAAAGQRRNGKVVARFCVDPNGRVEARSIEITRSHGDDAVDRITTAALRAWRFSPMKVGNTPRRACSRATFNIRFD
jgi:TonB family protein